MAQQVKEPAVKHDNPSSALQSPRWTEITDAPKLASGLHKHMCTLTHCREIDNYVIEGRAVNEWLCRTERMVGPPELEEREALGATSVPERSSILTRAAGSLSAELSL